MVLEHCINNEKGSVSETHTQRETHTHTDEHYKQTHTQRHTETDTHRHTHTPHTRTHTNLEILACPAVPRLGAMLTTRSQQRMAFSMIAFAKVVQTQNKNRQTNKRCGNHPTMQYKQKQTEIQEA